MRNLHSRIRWRRIDFDFDFDSALRPGRGTAQDQNDFDFDSALRPGGDTAQDQNDFDFDPALRQGARSRIRDWYGFSRIFDPGFDPALRPGPGAT